MIKYLGPHNVAREFLGFRALKTLTHALARTRTHIHTVEQSIRWGEL